MSDVKFSEFASGGQLTTGDIIVGLRSGVNTQFTSPDNPSGPFLLKSADLSDLLNSTSAIQNLGLGRPGILILTDSDFSGAGGTYVLTNPAPIIVSMSCNNPGNILRLPPSNEPDSLQESQSIWLLSSGGSQSVGIENGVGTLIFLVESESSWKAVSNDRTSVAGSWVFLGEVLTINGFVTGNMEITSSNNSIGVTTNSSSIDLAGLISTWNSSTTPIDVTAGSGISITGGTIDAVVNTWDGSTTPVNVTAGSGISILDGEISLTGTGPSIALGSAWVNDNNFSTSFTDASTFKGIRVDNFNDVETNFLVAVDGLDQIYFQYIGEEAASFRIGLTTRLRTVSNTIQNSYNYSVGIDSGSGIVPVYSSDAVMRFVTNGNVDVDSVLVPYNIIVQLNPNDKLYPIIQNRGDVNPTLNEYIARYLIADIEKVGDVGGAVTGVVSLNGLTGILSLTGDDNSVTISPSGLNVDLSVGQYIQVSGTSQAMLANKSYICMNSSTTSLSLPTSNCPVGSFIEIAGYGATTGLFTITQSSGQQIFFGTTSTTLGATGTLSVDSSNYLSALKLVCVADDTMFMVVNSQGNFVPA